MPDTFVAKRYHLVPRAYVDSKNVKLQDRFPKWLGDPSKPPRDGSTPFLSLPTELRLQIYGYLTHNDGLHLDDFKRSFNLPPSSGQSTTFAYLYRSPGRVTKPHAISKQVIDLFHVCHKMREELIDACFSDRTFVLEASLYKRDAGGLFVLPSNPGPTAWVKKLALLTTIEAHGFVKGIADLRPLQQMTNLKVLYLGLQITNTYGNCKLNVLERPDNILKAVIECVPKDTEVHFAFDSTIQRELFADLNVLKYESSLDNLDGDTRTSVTALIDILAASMHIKGRLSGSLVNHSLCEYCACQEGLDCINSQCKVVIRESQLSDSPTPSSFELKRVKEQKIEQPLTTLGIGETSNAANPDAKRCVHGYTRCYTCEKGLMQKVKCWSGRVYRY
jgi:hypothetical protein